VCSPGLRHGPAVSCCKCGNRSSTNSINFRGISDWLLRKASASFLPAMLLSVVSSILFVTLLGPFVCTKPFLWGVCVCVCVCVCVSACVCACVRVYIYLFAHAC
jgi:hypothetical protein